LVLPSDVKFYKKVSAIVGIIATLTAGLWFLIGVKVDPVVAQINELKGYYDRHSENDTVHPPLKLMEAHLAKFRYDIDELKIDSKSMENEIKKLTVNTNRILFYFEKESEK